MLLDKINKLNIGLVKENEPMKEHTTFRIGGPADIYVIPSSEGNLVRLLELLEEEGTEAFILGKGSNLLVTDEGIRGVVIDISEAFTDISVDGNILTTGAGNTVTMVSNYALKNSLSGMERISGIPGSIGGGVAMNAGAYGSEFKDVVLDIRAIDKNLEIKSYTNEELNLRYRNSRVFDDGLIVLSCRFLLEKDEPEKIKDLMEEIKEKRTSKQPLNYPSGGSTFKRPEGYYAAALIEDSGMKGVIHRGARVSDKHSGFIINHDGANFKDVYELIELVRKEVYDYSGVDLELEVKIVGENSEAYR